MYQRIVASLGLLQDRRNIVVAGSKCTPTVRFFNKETGELMNWSSRDADHKIRDWICVGSCPEEAVGT